MRAHTLKISLDFIPGQLSRCARRGGGAVEAGWPQSQIIVHFVDPNFLECRDAILRSSIVTARFVSIHLKEVARDDALLCVFVPLSDVAAAETDILPDWTPRNER